ncbi:pepsin-like aspartic protease [Aliikangiella coralliicola]|uniref:A1 family peptidase n=1 Tax=Aliikangiella coralliicola TaxID=2592383 RepID=A0A545U531_9GAMM|nr:pepsin-like aspartic protease [Aliikangiella coralliicola]TQV84513.1 A1 family peptidase [Aliikangiella coralliicola]
MMGKDSRAKTLRMPITNVYARGGFSVTVSFGSETDTAELVLDTGSSTLVVTQAAYETKIDQELKPTTYAQCIQYGMGGWYGPVVKTGVDMITHNGSMLLDNTNVSVATVYSEGSFADADGILGLAFHELNDGHNLQEYLVEKQVNPEVTFPWQNTGIEKQSVSDFRKFLRSQPKEDLKPYFTKLEEQGVSANKFSFVTRRSSIHHAAPKLTKEELKKDPLNQGMFILGGGEEDTDLYEGEFTRIKVIDDVYYNVRLLQVKVGNCEPFDAPLLKGKKLERHHSNAFVDTGASLMVLDNVVYNYIIDCFEKINPTFKEILEPFLTFEYKEEGIPLEKLNVEEWPDIEFIFEASEDCQEKEVSLICRSDDYWQVNAPQHGQASFKIISQLEGWPDQSILGLPLLSDYYVIFARFENEFGDIKVAKAKID